eukprot:500924-Alexandrium_andersonii.AAC.1
MGWASPETTAALRRTGAAMCFERLSAVRARRPRPCPTPRRERLSKAKWAPRSRAKGRAGARRPRAPGAGR